MIPFCAITQMESMPSLSSSKRKRTLEAIINSQKFKTKMILKTFQKMMTWPK